MKRVFVLIAVLALLGLSGAAMAVDVNGGSSWGGWTLKGMSNELGVYGSGTTDNPYNVYTTVFTYNSDPITDNPTGGSGQGAVGIFGGGFVDGDTIIGVGVKMLGGESVASYLPTLKFDIANNSYSAASSVGGTDGRVSGSTWAHAGDFNMNANVGNGWRPGDLAIYDGSGGNKSGGVINSLNVPLASFAQGDSYQLFMNMSRISSFASNSGYWTTPIPAFGSELTMCLNGYGDNHVVVQTAVPEPGTIVAALGLLGPAAMMFRRKRA